MTDKQTDLMCFLGHKKFTKKPILESAISVDRFAKKIDRSTDRQRTDLIFWDTLILYPTKKWSI